MAKNQYHHHHHNNNISSSQFSLHFCYVLFTLALISSIPFLYFSINPCKAQNLNFFSSKAAADPPSFSGHLDSLPFAWNHLTFSSNPPPKRLNIALFVKKWPRGDRAGGLERHALTLHLALAARGHATHVFTVYPGARPPPELSPPNLHYHFSAPTRSGGLDQGLAWQQFLAANSTRAFDVIHTESVGLHHFHARNLTNVAVSWHGIAYECVHSDIAQDLARAPGEPRPVKLKSIIADRVFKVIEEVKFFDDYAHHVATSDHVGDILRRIYMIPQERVHVILNGVDEKIFKHDPSRGLAFRRKHGVPDSAKLVLGMSGRLVKDKGHPIMVEALKQILRENALLLKDVYLLVAGDGPWGDRYRELGKNMLVLGPLDRLVLSDFYNAIDVFVHPTLRAQGLDQTVLEAMLSGKPVMVARFAGITESAIVGPEMGYVFSPKVVQVKENLYRVIKDGRDVLSKKGEVAKQRALKLFTASKMAAAFERMFLCISNEEYCRYPLPSD
ncbi:hypothetical protein QJS10_CPB14g00742 [Acorus calamus]|uniref:Glycosyltransferase subfamily 4-like N-terminal domain-containing protein n=1 Tax=Acorus calamus TaxID=4465 RepID=A0AAV9DBX8_ACOCL|nr:hypothetical protein QJS10_CPB14g00742 [Acorus calamus]